MRKGLKASFSGTRLESSRTASRARGRGQATAEAPSRDHVGHRASGSRGREHSRAAGAGGFEVFGTDGGFGTRDLDNDFKNDYDSVNVQLKGQLSGETEGLGENSGIIGCRSLRAFLPPPLMHGPGLRLLEPGRRAVCDGHRLCGTDRRASAEQFLVRNRNSGAIRTRRVDNHLRQWRHGGFNFGLVAQKVPKAVSARSC